MHAIDFQSNPEAAEAMAARCAKMCERMFYNQLWRAGLSGFHLC
jgi:hypothetical protein